MHDAVLTALLHALDQSPGNTHLVDAMVRLCHPHPPPEALLDALRRTEPSTLAEEPRLLAAELLARAGESALALRWSDGDEPAARVGRAKVLLALKRAEEARSTYEQAVEDDPTLEEPALELQLHPGARDVRTPQGGTLVVLGRHDPVAAADYQPPPTFADVGGYETLKTSLRARLAQPGRLPRLLARFRRSARGAVLLYGPPGCGKTLLVQALAGETSHPLVHVRVGEVLDRYVGESEARLHALCEQARAQAPAILFFDDLEALGGARALAPGDRSLAAQLQTELDGAATNNEQILIVAATNVPWSIDPALRRAGRFDHLLFVPPPSREDRLAILQVHLRERPAAHDIDLDRLVRRTSTWSGADLAQLVDRAADRAITASISARREVPIDDTHLHAAAHDLAPSTLEWLTTARNHVRYTDAAQPFREIVEFLDAHARQRR